MQAIANMKNLGKSFSQTLNVNPIHVDEEAMETTLVLSDLSSGNSLSYPYKDYPSYKGSISEETSIVSENDNSSE